MNQILAIRPGVIDKEQKAELKKQGFIIIECADPKNDFKIFSAYGEISPDGLLSCALRALSYGADETKRQMFAKHVMEAALKNIPIK